MAKITAKERHLLRKQFQKEWNYLYEAVAEVVKALPDSNILSILTLFVASLLYADDDLAES